MARARAEQQELGISGGLTREKLKQMTYLEQILKEVERLYPPVGGGFRGVVKPFVFDSTARVRIGSNSREWASEEEYDAERSTLYGSYALYCQQSNRSAKSPQNGSLVPVVISKAYTNKQANNFSRKDSKVIKTLLTTTVAPKTFLLSLDAFTLHFKILKCLMEKEQNR